MGLCWVSGGALRARSKVRLVLVARHCLSRKDKQSSQTLGILVRRTRDSSKQSLTLLYPAWNRAGLREVLNRDTKKPSNENLHTSQPNNSHYRYKANQDRTKKQKNTLGKASGRTTRHMPFPKSGRPRERFTSPLNNKHQPMNTSSLGLISRPSHAKSAED